MNGEPVVKEYKGVDGAASMHIITTLFIATSFTFIPATVIRQRGNEQVREKEWTGGAAACKGPDKYKQIT